MCGYDEPLCFRCKWQEEAPYKNCKDCSDHAAGTCLMAEAYQQGRKDAIDEIIKRFPKEINRHFYEDYFIEWLEQIKEQAHD